MYTTDREGLINNYAVEPQMYYAAYPSPEQQARYAISGMLATLFINLLLLTAFVAS
jgi:hypothetical protein